MSNVEPLLRWIPASAGMTTPALDPDPGCAVLASCHHAGLDPGCAVLPPLFDWIPASAGMTECAVLASCRHAGLDPGYTVLPSLLRWIPVPALDSIRPAPE